MPSVRPSRRQEGRRTRQRAERRPSPLCRSMSWSTPLR
jgi:hypothetical protein